MLFYVYILESQTSGRWYYGYSDDLEQRVLDHQTNRSKYTRFKGPWTLIFKREFDNKTEALQFESYLKKTKNKNYIRREFAKWFLVT
jgi:putative endonuclease